MANPAAGLELANEIPTSIPGDQTTVPASGNLLMFPSNDAWYLMKHDGTVLPLAGVTSARQIIAGAGMTGGGDLTADRTLNVIANADGSIAVHADDIQLAQIPNDVPVLGDLLATAIAAPATPAAGKGRYYLDSTSKNFAIKNDAGTVNHGVQTKAAVTSNWLTAISDAGVVTASQPAASDLSNGTTGIGGGVVLANGPIIHPKDIGGFVYVDNVNTQGWAGSDFGAWTNSAYLYVHTTYTDNNGGVIQWGAGSATYATPIVMVNAGLMSIIARGMGDGNGATILNYTGTVLPGLSIGGGSGNDGGVQLENFTMTGTAQGNGAVGIQIGTCVNIIQTLTISAAAVGNWTATWHGLTASGLSPTITNAALQTALQTAWNNTAVTVAGGPGGTSPLTVTIPGSNELITATNPATSGTTTVGNNTGAVCSTAGASLKNVSIRRFTTGINQGQGTIAGNPTAIAYGINFNNVKVQQTTVGYAPFGEANVFTGGLLGGGATGCVPAGASAEVSFVGTAFDDNTVTGMNISNANQRIHLLGARFENAGGGTDVYITISAGTVSMQGGALQSDLGSGTATGFVQASGTAIVNTTNVWHHATSGRTFTQLYNVTGSAIVTVTTPIVSPAATFTGGLVWFTTAATTQQARLISYLIPAVMAATSAAINTTDTQLTAMSIPAGAWVAGAEFEIELTGTCTASVANASTFTLRAGTGGVVGDTAIATFAITSAATGTNIPFVIKIKVRVPAIGTTVTVVGVAATFSQGLATGTSSGIQAFPVDTVVLTGTNTLNTTTATFLGISYKTAAITTTSTFLTADIKAVR